MRTGTPSKTPPGSVRCGSKLQEALELGTQDEDARRGRGRGRRRRRKQKQQPPLTFLARVHHLTRASSLIQRLLCDLIQSRPRTTPSQAAPRSLIPQPSCASPAVSYKNSVRETDTTPTYQAVPLQRGVGVVGALACCPPPLGTDLKSLHRSGVVREPDRGCCGTGTAGVWGGIGGVWGVSKCTLPLLWGIGVGVQVFLFVVVVEAGGGGGGGRWWVGWRMGWRMERKGGVGGLLLELWSWERGGMVKMYFYIHTCTASSSQKPQPWFLSIHPADVVWFGLA